MTKQPHQLSSVYRKVYKYTGNSQIKTRDFVEKKYLKKNVKDLNIFLKNSSTTFSSFIDMMSRLNICEKSLDKLESNHTGV